MVVPQVKDIRVGVFLRITTFRSFKPLSFKLGMKVAFLIWSLGGVHFHFCSPQKE